MLNWTFDLDNYYDDGGIKCTDGSKNYLVFFAAECTGVAEGRYNGSGDDEEFDIEDAYCDDIKFLDCEAVLDDEEAEDKIGSNPDYVFANYRNKTTLDNCDPEAKEMWKKLKTKDGLSIIDAIGALADEYAWDTAGDEEFDEYPDPKDDYADEHYHDDDW